MTTVGCSGQKNEPGTLTVFDFAVHGVTVPQAITDHGGPHLFGKKMGLASARNRSKSYGYWTNLENVKREMVEWLKTYGKEGIMPKTQELVSTGHGGLAVAISNLGGAKAFAKKLGLEIQKGGRGYWSDGRLEKEMLNHCTKVCLHSKHIFPRCLALIDLIVVRSYSTCLITVCCLICGQDKDGNMFLPSQEALFRNGRKDLVSAIFMYGGYRKLAAKMGVSTLRRKKRSAEHVFEDVTHVMQTSLKGVVRLPTKADFERVGRHDLVLDIQQQGGFKRFAVRVGLPYRPAGTKHFHEVDNVDSREHTISMLHEKWNNRATTH